MDLELSGAYSLSGEGGKNVHIYQFQVILRVRDHILRITGITVMNKTCNNLLPQISGKQRFFLPEQVILLALQRKEIVMLLLVRKGSSNGYWEFLFQSLAFVNLFVLTVESYWNTYPFDPGTTSLHSWSSLSFVSHLFSCSSFPLVLSFLREVSDISPTYFMNTKAYLFSFFFLTFVSQLLFPLL